MPNPYDTYHMCHMKAQNMIDMTSMIAALSDKLDVPLVDI